MYFTLTFALAFRVLQGIIKWLMFMVQLIVFGTTFVLWASIGNSSNPNPLSVIISMGAIVTFAVAPFFFEFELPPKENGVIISTVKRTSGESTSVVVVEGPVHVSMNLNNSNMNVSLSNGKTSIFPCSAWRLPSDTCRA